MKSIVYALKNINEETDPNIADLSDLDKSKAAVGYVAPENRIKPALTQAQTIPTKPVPILPPVAAAPTPVPALTQSQMMAQKFPSAPVTPAPTPVTPAPTPVPAPQPVKPAPVYTPAPTQSQKMAQELSSAPKPTAGSDFIQSTKDNVNNAGRYVSNQFQQNFPNAGQTISNAVETGKQYAGQAGNYISQTASSTGQAIKNAANHPDALKYTGGIAALAAAGGLSYAALKNRQQNKINQNIQQKV